MKPLGRASIAEMLEAWGRQEAQSRFGKELGSLKHAIDFALTTRGLLLSLIFSALPVDGLLVELTPADITDDLRIADGRSLDEWTTAVLADQGPSGRDVRLWSERDDEVKGPLICASQSRPLGGSPVVIFDGWHRAATWCAHARRGKTYSLTAGVIITKHEIPVWRA